MSKIIATKDSGVIGVGWSSNKQGVLKPLVEINPVNLKGRVIKEITSFNTQDVIDNYIRPGAIIRVSITEDGKVSAEVTKKGENPSPRLLPSMFFDYEESEGDWIVSKPSDDICINAIEEFFQKIDIESLQQEGRDRLLAIYKAGYNTVLKIILASKDDLKQVPGLEKREAETIYDEIHDRLKNIPLSLILSASRIFGALKRWEIGNLFLQSPNLLNFYQNWGAPQLYSHIKAFPIGFSNTFARNISKNIKSADLFLKVLKELGATIKDEVEPLSSRLGGKKVVFSNFRDRELKDRIYEKGGTVSSRVSKDTLAVIVPDVFNYEKTRTVQEATRLKIPIMDRELFLAGYGFLDMMKPI